jgi:hypothetical protein
MPVIRPLTGVERAEQHDAGVVDQDTGGAELLADTVGGDDDAVAVSDVRFDGSSPVAQFVGEGGDEVEPTATLPGVLSLVMWSGLRDLAAEALQGDGGLGLEPGC